MELWITGAMFAEERSAGRFREIPGPVEQLLDTTPTLRVHAIAPMISQQPGNTSAFMSVPYADE
jgi:hypothetical protein